MSAMPMVRVNVIIYAKGFLQRAPQLPVRLVTGTHTIDTISNYFLVANKIAAAILAASALFCPAMSKAVPWVGEVRRKSSPAVMCTIGSCAASFSPSNAWS